MRFRRTTRRWVSLCLAVGVTGGGCSTSGADRTSIPTAVTTGPPTTGPTTTSTTLAPTTTLPAIPPVVSNGPRDRPEVALTFDADMTTGMAAKLDRGTVASYDNAAVVDILERMQAPATMFLTGMWMERYPDSARRLAANPLFELANHSYGHQAFRASCYGLPVLAVEEMLASVARTDEILHQFSTAPTRYFRFPGGCLDETALRAIAPSGVTVIQFDLASGDAFGTSVRAIVDTVVRGAQNGSIIVFHLHGGDAAPLTDDALPAVVDGLRSRGFQLVKVSDLLR